PPSQKIGKEITADGDGGLMKVNHRPKRRLVRETCEIVLVLLASLSFATHADEVFRWVDEKGKVHYGSSIPERFKQKAKKIDAEGNEVSNDRRKEAEARAARDRAAVEAIQKSRETKSEKADKAQPAAAATPDTKL